MTDQTGNKSIRVAIITGQHPYDVVSFQTLFRSVPDLDIYPQSLEDFGTDTGSGRDSYDVLVFYTMHQSTPRDASAGDVPGMEQGTLSALQRLGEREQGILVLHHAILAFPSWQLWSDLCGIQDRRFGYHLGQTVHIEVAAPDHPITWGLPDWDMPDETYTMADAGEGNDILLVTQHPLSMHTIAWTRQYRRARVLCLQSGHDNLAYSNPHFGRFVAQGIRWLAGRPTL